MAEQLRRGLYMSYQESGRGARRGCQRAIRSWPAVAAIVGFLVAVGPLAGQDLSADSSAVLAGALTGVEDGQPIPYATVILTASGRASFADANGDFRIARLVPGTYAIRARQIGYSPLDTTVVIQPGPDETLVKLRLHRIAFRLAQVRIHGRGKGCVATGVPDSTVDPSLAAIFTQVRENVDRFRILVDQYPFTFSREERHMLRRDPGGDSTTAIDTVDYESRARRPYRVGGIIYIDFDPVGRRRRFMYLPNFGDLADPAFLSAHCFAYGGAATLGSAGGAEVIRIDFRPADRISAPDVEGAVYLDAKRYIVRRAVFRMTRSQKADPPVLGLSVTTTFRELVPLVPVFDSVQSIQELPVATQAASAGLPGNFGGEAVHRSGVELDRLLGFTFEQRAPGQQSAGPSPSATTAMVVAPPASTASNAAETPATLVTGRVLEADGTPVVGATVGFIGFRDTVTTSDSGRFTLPGHTPGARMLVARRLGFTVAHVPVTVVRDRTRTVRITLARSVHVLPTVTTTAVARAYHDVGLDRRMRAGVGQFVTYAQIQRRQATKFSQLLTGLHGISVWQQPLEYESTVQGTRGVGSCVAFVVDGSPQAVLSKQDADNVIDPSEIAAIEVYSAAERPSGLGSGLEERPPSDPSSPQPKVDFDAQQCTLVVVWTRSHLGLPLNSDASESTEPGGTRGRPVFPNIAMCEPDPAADTIRALLSATLQSTAFPAGSDTAWSGYVDRVLAVVRTAFVMPSDLPISVFGYPFPMAELALGTAKPREASPALAVAPTLSSVFAFTLDSNGTVGGLRTAASSLSGPADTSVLAAISEADAAHAFPPMPPSVRSHGAVHFDLIVSTIQPQDTRHSTALGSVLVPVWPLRRAVAVASGTQPNLGEPDAIHVGTDSIALELIVDDRGRAVMSSVRELHGGVSAAGDDSRFRSRVIRALPEFRFDPALIGACPVPEMMQPVISLNGVIGTGAARPRE